MISNTKTSANHSFQSWYDLSSVDEILENFLASSLNLSHHRNELYKYDLVDITRQMIQNKVEQLYLKIVTSVDQQSLNEFDRYVHQFELLLNDLERILRTNNKFLLGNWLESAKNLATNDHEMKMYEFNARNQITIWGPTGQVYDYAMKQWAGMISDYCLPRWKFFFDKLRIAFEVDQPFNETECQKNIFKNIEEPFVNDNKLYAVEGYGDTIAIAREIYEKWKFVFN